MISNLLALPANALAHLLAPPPTPHLAVSGQVLDGHLAGFGGTQPYLGLWRGLWLLPQDVLVGQDVPVECVPQDQLAGVRAAGKQAV